MAGEALQSPKKQLSDEDQQRVDRYLDAPSRAGMERQFRPWKLLLFIWVLLVAMGGFSYLIALNHGVV